MKYSKSILDTILQERKLVTYEDTIAMSREYHCKEDTIRRGLEPDRTPNVIKIFNENNCIIGWKLIDKNEKNKNKKNDNQGQNNILHNFNPTFLLDTSSNGVSTL